MRTQPNHFRRAVAPGRPRFGRVRSLFLLATTTLLLTGAHDSFAAPDDVAGTDDVVWDVQRPQGHTVRDIHFIDAQRGWFVAGQADIDCVIMRTTDGGDSWQNLDCPVSSRPDAVHFVDAMTGWVVGRDGMILRTDNGGLNWGRQSSGTSATLTGVHAVDTNYAWISARAGYILRTTDGGAEWDREGTGADSGLFDVHFLDRDHGWAAGGNGRIIRTQTGGREWYLQPSGTDGDMKAVAVADIDFGWAVGHHIRYTNNGGGNWRRQREVDKSLEDVAVIDREYVWTVGDEATILLTRDGGNTWTSEGDPRSYDRRGVTTITAPDRGHMWAGTTGGYILRRIDTGVAPPPTEPPPTSLPPTSTPVPPTATPLPRTPTPTITPTPTVAWVDVAHTGQPFLVPAYGEKPLEIAYGNMGPSEVMSATLEGPILFPDGTTTYSTTIFTSGGTGTFPLVLRPDPAADPAPAPGDVLTIVVTMGGVTERLDGRVAYRAMFPWILKNHPEWLLPDE